MRAGVPLVILLLGAVPAAAQRAAPPARTWWASLGVGAGYLDAGADFAFHVAASAQSGRHVVSLRVAGVTTFYEDLFGLTGDPEDVTDVGILYGRGTERGPVRSSAGIGLGLAHVSRVGADGAWVVSLPLEAQVAWRPLPVLGLGLYAFANVNGEQSVGAVTMMVQAGRLR
jgi:hypothetical protein